MANFKSLRKFFKHRDNKDDGNEKATASLHSAPTSSTPLPLTRQQLVQSFESRPRRASLFFSLPGELRNRIYFHTTYPSMPSICIYKSPESVLSANIFHLCRQIRSEAISHLCATKSINLANLRIANEFFGLVGDELPSLRRVTIRCPIVWRLGTKEVSIEKRDLLKFLELATGLMGLSIVIKGPLLSDQEDRDLQDPQSVGSSFLHAVRGVVDRDAGRMQDKMAAGKEILTLHQQVGAKQTPLFSKDQLGEEHEQGVSKVFRLCKVSHLDCWRHWSCQCGSEVLED